MLGKCLHCGLPASKEEDFCCKGCKVAYSLVQSLGLGQYYEKRILDEATRPPKPIEEYLLPDLSSYIKVDAHGIHSLSLMVEGLHCAYCVWLIESVLSKQESVTSVRINMTTRRMQLCWQGDALKGRELVNIVSSLGYHLVLFNPEKFASFSYAEEVFLLKCLAVAGFAAGNLMLISISLWSSNEINMGQATRNMLHLISMLIGIPCILYAARPFFRSSINALKNRRTNMDVPISLAVLLSCLVSGITVMKFDGQIYFESASMLLLFLLIGRFFDLRLRNKARSIVQDMLMLMSGQVRVIDAQNNHKIIPVEQLIKGMTMIVAAGEKIRADGVVKLGHSSLDNSIITGESLPQEVNVGHNVLAGSINLEAALHIEVSKVGNDTILGEIIKLVEQAEQRKTRFMQLSDRVARLYTPVVHILSLTTFIVWLIVLNASWHQALLIATAVLIITCPCALALAVPIVHVLASSRLMKQGVFLKTSDALEKLLAIDTVVFDKTGTLTLGHYQLLNHQNCPIEQLQLAASLAASSMHPLAKAIVSAYHGELLLLQVIEYPGCGVSAIYRGKEVKLGSRNWVGAPEVEHSNSSEVWLLYDGEYQRFEFQDQLKIDAKHVIKKINDWNLKVLILSGDKHQVVKEVARQLGITEYYAEKTLVEKYQLIEDLQRSGKRILMIGDGMNDAPSLSLASVSMSPTSAIDISQNAANIVFQGNCLKPVVTVLEISRLNRRLAKQNIVIALCYNLIAVPAAVCGMVTPLIAAVAMSSSSLIVMLNSFRIRK